MILDANLGYIQRGSKAETCCGNDDGGSDGCEEDDIASFMRDRKRDPDNVAEDKILVERTCSENPAAKVR